jgi:hypothetical protein
VVQLHQLSVTFPDALGAGVDPPQADRRPHSAAATPPRIHFLDI